MRGVSDGGLTSFGAGHVPARYFAGSPGGDQHGGLSPLDVTLIAQHGGIGVAQVSLTGEILEANDAFCALMGYARDDLIGGTFQRITHPDDLGRNLELLENLIAGRIDSYRMEKRYVRANGEILWTDLFVSMMRHDGTEPPRLISVVTDITEHKQNEERLRFMLNETTHRTRNILSVVQVTARQIAKASNSIEDFRTALDGRLSSLAAAQNTLTSEDSAHGVLAEIVRAQLNAFLTPQDPRIMLSGPHLVVGGNAARAIGLAIYELGTNACKYGALSSREGEIEIAWRADGDDFEMSWIERNGPRVETPSRIGFGRKVVEQMIAASFSGKVSLDFAPEGVTWRLAAPLRQLG